MSDIAPIGATNRRQRLSPSEQAEVARLAARDREVRAHEAQHAATAGGMAAGIQYEFEVGPDGKMYAVAGHTKIHVPPARTPEEALANARKLRAAANATADPSGQDMAVSAHAGQMEAEAIQKVAQKNAAQLQGSADSQAPGSFRRFDRFA